MKTAAATYAWRPMVCLHCGHSVIGHIGLIATTDAVLVGSRPIDDEDYTVMRKNDLGCRGAYGIPGQPVRLRLRWRIIGTKVCVN